VIEDKSGAALAWILPFPSIVITLCGGQAPGRGCQIEGTMSHDKIRAAARKRQEQTGEPYAAARRAAVNEHQAAGDQASSQFAGYVLRMSGEVHEWLADLRGRDSSAATRVAQALTALMTEGGSIGDPLVSPPAASERPADQREALDSSYQERLEQLEIARRGEAAADSLIKDLQDQLAELESAQARLDGLDRRTADAGRPHDAAQAASQLVAVQQQLAEVRRLLPGVIEARQRLGKAVQRMQARVDAFRVRKEGLKARYAAARGSLMAREAIAALASDDTEHQQVSGDEAVGAARGRLADVAAEVEQELGQETWPEGLMELPATPGDSGIRILFAVEPPGAVQLIAVLEGLEPASEQYREAVMLSAVRLQRMRAGQASGAAAHSYDDPRSFLTEFQPGNANEASAGNSSQ
jgi:phage shock protein A